MTGTSLRVHEIFFSIQGESLFAGLPTVFVRTSACNLRCTYCDTKYAYGEGEVMAIADVISRVQAYPARFVCVTGGEPLGQKSTIILLGRLLAEGYTVSLETNGSFSLRDVPAGVVKVLDIKCPASGETEAMAWENLDLVGEGDQIKFVVADRNDFDWAADLTRERRLTDRCAVLFSPAHESVLPRELAEWLLESGLDARMQVQLHKIIWGAEAQGV